MLTFRIKHFPGKPELIESEYVRYLIFLQIRNYLLKGDLQLPLSEETRLAAYAVQASLGDFDVDIHKENYLAGLKFLSRSIMKTENAIVELHKQLRLDGHVIIFQLFIGLIIFFLFFYYLVANLQLRWSSLFWNEPLTMTLMGPNL